MKKEIGKLLLDIAKITFATTFLGAILNTDINDLLIICSSLGISVALSVIGLFLTKDS